MKRRRFLFHAGGAAVLVTALACREQPPAPPDPDWLKHVVISVDGARPSFDNHTEVQLSIANQGSSPLSIDRLGSHARLDRSGGNSSLLHDISVGVAKPIAVLPNSTLKTSLLFRAGSGAPQQLHLYGLTLAVPDHPAP